MLEKLEKVTGRNVKTLTKMNNPAPWIDVLKNIQAINFCTEKAKKLMKAMVGPRNLFEALENIKKMAEYEQNMAKRQE